MLYLLCKEKIAVMKSKLLLDLIGSLDVSVIGAFVTCSPAKIRNMVLLLVRVIKEKFVDKIKESQGFTYSTDEVTDISKVQNLLLFVRYYSVQKSKTATNFAHKLCLLAESETTSADALSIFQI